MWRLSPPSRLLAANLPDRPGVIPADKHLLAEGNAMSRTTIKGPLVTLAVAAGLLAVAGPVGASAQAVSSSAPIDPGKESFSIDIGTSERVAVAASAVVTDNKDPDKANGIIAILIG